MALLISTADAGHSGILFNWEPDGWLCTTTLRICIKHRSHLLLLLESAIIIALFGQIQPAERATRSLELPPRVLCTNAAKQMNLGLPSHDRFRALPVLVASQLAPRRGAIPLRTLFLITWLQ